MPTLPTDLLEEYRLCQEKVSNNGAAVWTTAALLGVGSITAIVLLASRDLEGNPIPLPLLVVFTLFAIGLVLAWWRFTLRWWSINQAAILRMRHIEMSRGSNMRTNLYVQQLDSLKEGCESPAARHLSQTAIDGLSRILHEHRREGLRPMSFFLVVTTIGLWVAFLALGVVRAVALTDQAQAALTWLVTLAFVATWAFILGRSWGRP